MILVHLPSHAPELNPVEKVWQYLRDRWLSHLVLPDYRAVLDGVCRAWSSLSLLRVGRERPNGWAILVWCGRRESRSCQEPIQLTYASECYGSASAAS